MPAFSRITSAFASLVNSQIEISVICWLILTPAEMAQHSPYKSATHHRHQARLYLLPGLKLTTGIPLMSKVQNQTPANSATADRACCHFLKPENKHKTFIHSLRKSTREALVLCNAMCETRMKSPTLQTPQAWLRAAVESHLGNYIQAEAPLFR